MSSPLFLDTRTSQWVITTAIVAATTIAAYIINKRHFAPIPGTDGPKPEFLIGNIRNFFIKHKNGWTISKSLEHYGPFVTLWMGPRRIVLVNDSTIVNEISKNKEAFSPDPHFMDAMGSVINYAMISLEGDIWKRHRKALTPILGNQRLKYLMTKMENTVNASLEVIKERIRLTDEPVYLKDEFSSMTMDTMGYLAFGRAFRDIDANDSDNLRSIDFAAAKEGIETLATEIGARILGFGTHRYIGDSKKVRHAKEELNKVTSVLLDEYEDNRKKMEANKLEDAEWSKFMDRSVIAQVLTSSEGADFTFEELRGEMINFILVGTDTTSGTLGFAVKLLSNHPHVQEKLYEEIITVVGKDATPTYEQLLETSMPYLDKVVKEIQRLSLVVPFTIRYSTKEIVLRNIVFPKRTAFWLSLTQMHRDPKYWKDPLSFLPERWNEDGIVNGGPVNLKAFLPFGAGLRACFGMRLANLELKFMVLYLVRTFFFKELPPHLQDKVGEEVVEQHAVVELSNVVGLPVLRP